MTGLLDGGMGTELFSRGWPRERNCADANVAAPHCVRAIHADYAHAGAQGLFTNTFQARTHEQLEAGVRLAREHPAAVWLALGPTYTAGQEDWTPADWWELAATVAQLADAVIVETVSDARVQAFLTHLLPVGVPVWLSLTYRQVDDPRTSDGNPPEWWAERAADWGLAGLGVNCVADCTAIVRRYRTETTLPLLAKPNTRAGLSAELWAAGATWVGGCCGTTPADLAALQRRRPPM